MTLLEWIHVSPLWKSSLTLFTKYGIYIWFIGGALLFPIGITQHQTWALIAGSAIVGIAFVFFALVAGVLLFHVRRQNRTKE